MLQRLTVVVVVAMVSLLPESDIRSTVADRVMKLGREASWKPVTSVAVGFPTHHPQGMVKIGDTFFVSSVDVTVPTRRFPAPVNGYDRDTGQGRGHLFKIDRTGKLLNDLPLGDGTVYHPGGIDFDGVNIWVPVSEYRPDSRSIVYRVDPERMVATEVFRFADHIGAVVHDPDDHMLVGVSWGSRRFYRWALGKDLNPTNATVPADQLRIANPSHYVDYQDCKYVGGHRMLCTGVTELRQRPDAAPFRLGGMDLVDLRDLRPLHQVPVLLWTPGGLDMTHNPVWIEVTDGGLRGYFMPEDDTSTIYVYDVEVR